MPSIRHSLILAALGLALGAPVAAQDTAPAAEAPAADAPAAETPAAPADEPPAADQPAAGQPAADQPAGDQPAADAPAAGTDAAGAGTTPPAQPEVLEIVRDKFGDWEVRCSPQGNECFMYQLALDQQNNPVAEVSILKLPESAEATAGVTVVTPLGTLLTAGVVVQVDTGEKRQYPFAWCSQVGCFARFGLDLPTLNGMKRGKAANLTLVSVGQPGQPVTLGLSLSGFTAAYDSLEVPTAPPAGTSPAGMPPAGAPAPAADAPAPAADAPAPAQN